MGHMNKGSVRTNLGWRDYLLMVMAVHGPRSCAAWQGQCNFPNDFLEEDDTTMIGGSRFSLFVGQA